MLVNRNTLPNSNKRRISKAAREDFRDELLAITRRIFMHEGHAAVTIRRITQEAGVTPMAFYWYFDCKEALLSVIWDEIIAESGHYSQAQAELAQPDQRDLAYCEALIDFWTARPEHFRAVFLSEAQHDDLRPLRYQLQKMPGAQQVYRALGEVLCASIPDACQQTRRQRTSLVIFRMIGFLHAIVDMRQTSLNKLTQWREWLRSDLTATFASWRAEKINSN